MWKKLKSLLPEFLFLTVVFAVSMTPCHAQMLMEPYLQAVTSNSIYVLVECDSKDTVTVEYGTSLFYGQLATTTSIEETDSLPVTYIHNIKLANLKPGTMYSYKVWQGSGPSATNTFTTAPHPGTDFRFAWMSDCSVGTAIHDNISTQIKKFDPKFLLYGGGLCSDPGTYRQYKDEFFRPNELQVIASIPFFNTVGDDEKWSKNTMAFTQAPESASKAQDYYSFDYGDVHFLCINSLNIGEDQYSFAKMDLKATKKKWKIVFTHKPAYCVGGAGEDLEVEKIADTVLRPNGVDLLLTGHSHFYQHNIVNGIHYMILGSAGAPLDIAGYSPFVMKSVSDHNYAVIDVTSKSLNIVVYNDRNSILDTVKLTKGSPFNSLSFTIIILVVLTAAIALLVIGAIVFERQDRIYYTD